MKRLLLSVYVSLMVLSLNAQNYETSLTTSAQSSEPYVLYGYLKVFPRDLGTFDTEPKNIIARLNQSQQYGYGTWRLPTNEELKLMRANMVLSSDEYMTQENKRWGGIVRLVTDREKGEGISSIPAGYVDLGLPSGTLWKEFNETDLYTGDKARSMFGNSLPTKSQWEELKNNCVWTRINNGYMVKGKSGKTIFLPNTDYRSCGGSNSGIGSYGYYWSSTPNGAGNAWTLEFGPEKIYISYGIDCYGLSVHLVK